jgi:hypothetical protein
MRVTGSFCYRLGGFIVYGDIGWVLSRFIGRPIVVTLATATSASAA